MTYNRFLLLSVVLYINCLLAFSQPDANKYPFQNPALSTDQRVNDLVDRMTIDEKVAQMLHASQAIPRLGIPAYNWWNECLHGVGRSEFKVTVFPQAIGMAATFDPDALKKSASVISDEARAVYNQTNKTSLKGAQYAGLTFWTPNINIFRDPRWGRGQETYGEDPYLTSRMGMAMVSGLQGNDPKFLKTAACAKHFAVHSGPEPGRNSFNSVVGMYDLWDTYLPAFEALITKANVVGVMCAYNRLNGQPCCGNDFLLNDILRNQWKFSGYMTSDCGAINDFTANHKTHATPEQAAADAVRHGTDLECGEVYVALKESLRKGYLTEADIDKSVKRLFSIRFRLGMFEPEQSLSFDTITTAVLESASHRQQAELMTRESMVLLRNSGILPFNSKIKKILLTGPNADNGEVQLGNYNGIPTEIITPLKALRAIPGLEVVYKKSTDILETNELNEQAALADLKDYDLIIYVGGISPRLEGEDGDAGKGNFEGFHGGDRTNIALPAVQTAFMKKIKAAGKPLVFVCMSGSAVAFDWEAAHTDAIIQAWYGGQDAGLAIADVLTGKYNPAGRLPVTFYTADTKLPDMSDYSMTHRTYRYFSGKTLYPFGYGLSFTKFNYKWIAKPEAKLTENDTLHCQISVQNSGKLAGDEVVQAYIVYPTGLQLPLKELRNFTRIHLLQGKSAIHRINIPVMDLKKWEDTSQTRAVIKGKYQLCIGTHSADKKLIATFEID